MWRIAATALLIICSSVACAAKSRTITANVPVQSLNALHLNVDVGRVTVGASHDDAVHVKVTVTSKQHGFLGLFHWSGTNDGNRLSGIKLNQSRQGRALALSLNYPSGSDHSHSEATWRINMPVRQLFKAKVAAGKLDLTGIAGGVDVEMDAGKIDIKVPRGAISATVQVGKIDAVSATSDRGDISLASDIGEARLHIPNTPKAESNQRSGMGQSVHLSGKGRDYMKLKVHVGKVDLTIKKPRR